MSDQSKLNRRQFIKGAAAAAGVAAAFPTIIPSSARGADGAVAPSNRITMGFLGVGSQGTSNMRGFLNQDQAQVIAVCDVDGENLNKAKNIVNEHYKTQDCQTYHDFRELLANGKIDAVAIAVPDHWHAILGVSAAKAGKDIYGEKPLARSIREARAIVRAVQRYGRVWQTGSWQRSRDEFYRAAMIVRNGRIGKVKYIEVGLPNGSPAPVITPSPCPPELDWNFWLGPAPYRPYQPFNSSPKKKCHWDWRWILDFSGGQMTDWAGHHIDIAHWGMGLDGSGPVEITGKGLYPSEGYWDAPMEYDFKCTYADGMVLRVANASKLKTGMGTKWFGENDQWVHVTRGGIDANPKSLLREPYSPDDIHLTRSLDHFKNFLDCVKTRQTTIAPAETACRSISVGLLGEIAMLTGRTIKWDPVTEEITNDPGAAELLGRSYREPWRLEFGRDLQA